MSELLKRAREYEQKKMDTIPQSQRPVFHFSAPCGWNNDPNGFSMFGKECHLFFQYYPYQTVWGPMHWGHAKTKDFLHWEILPAALAPDESYDNFGVFSGGAVEADGKQYLMYTGVVETVLPDGTKQVRQNQCLAVGDGINYEKADCNPVITADMLPKGSSLEDFRDPKLWEENGTYYVAVGSRHEDGSGQVALFESENLYDWKYVTILDRSANRYGKMWECPDFFPLNDKRVLVVSPQDMMAEGYEFHNGNGTIFIQGNYDEKEHRFSRTNVQTVDYGLDFYAPQTMEAEDGRRILIAWMQSWDNHMLPGFDWSGMMTVPRELRLENGRICQIPVREVKDCRRNPVSYAGVLVDGEKKLSGISGRVVDLELEVSGDDYQTFEIQVAADERFHSSIKYDREEGTLTFDRTFSGFCRDVIAQRTMKVREIEGKLRLRILLDRYSCEIFVNDGEQAMTSLIYTPQCCEEIRLFSKGLAEVNIEKYDII